MGQIITIGQIQQNFAQNILGEAGFKFIQTKGHVHFQGEIIRTFKSMDEDNFSSYK